MSDYRIVLSRNGLLLAELSVSSARYVEVSRELRERFSQDEGFALQIERRREVRRILEQNAQGLRLLGIEYRHEEVPQ